jgi:hypothetical protein
LKVALSFKQLTTKQYKLTARERLLVIVGIGVIVLGITLYMTAAEEAVDPAATTSVPKVATPLSVTPVLLGKQLTQVNPTEKGLRDPFAKVPEATSQKNDAPPPLSMPVLQNNIPGSIPSMVPKNTFPNSIPQQDFKLTGIVSGGNTALAVIVSGSKSRSYAINDMIGGYRLVAINSNGVVLNNGDRNVTLHLESFGQKEGKTIEK